MSEGQKKAFDAAQDTIKQLLTLATSIIGGLVIFSGTGPNASINLHAHGTAVSASVIALLISIVAGFFGQMCIVGELTKGDEATVYRPSIRFFTILQILAFAFAIIYLSV